MISFVKLIRLPNLLLIGLAMFFVRFFLIIPIFQISANINPDLQLNKMLRLNNFDFSLMVCSVILIAAAGNIINDYFDVKIDRRNKPEKVLIGTKFSSKTILILYFLFNFLGLAFGAYASFKSGVNLVLFIILFSATILWFYSKNFKKAFLIGNITVAFLSALVFIIPAIAEPEFYFNFRFVMVYALFAFLLSLIREIIKDLEDEEGDRLEGCRTLPILLGFKKSQVIVLFLLSALILFITYVLYTNFKINSVTRVENIITIGLLPFALLFYLIIQMRTKKDIHFISGFIKLLMLLGICSMIPLWYFFMH